MERYRIGDIEIVLPDSEDVSKFSWIGSKDYLNDVMAAFYKAFEEDIPMTPKISGIPGIGKTTLVGAAAKELGLDLYIMQVSADTRPEDLVITPVLNRDRQIIYIGSPLLAAVIKGGVVILDEANRMPEKSWATLASLLDHRRSLYSNTLGIKFEAHPEFRIALTVNEDSSVFEIPDYIASRIAPNIKIGFPSKEDELKILKYHLPLLKDNIIKICVEFMQQLHEYNLPYSVRDAINALRLLNKKLKGHESLNEIKELFYSSFSAVVGKPIDKVKQELENAKNSSSETEYIENYDIDEDDDFLDFLNNFDSDDDV